MKKYVSLVLSVIIFFSSFGSHTVYAQNGSGDGDIPYGQDDMQAMEDLTDENKDGKEGDGEKHGESPADGKEGDKEDKEDEGDEGDKKDEVDEGGKEDERPELKSEAAVSDFTLEYNEPEDEIILKYQLNDAASYVEILVDGRPVQTDYDKVYTSYSYDLPEEAEGKEYIFQIVPYELRYIEGNAVKLRGTPSERKTYKVPYKQAVLSDMDIEYDLIKKYLTIEWFGIAVSSVDIYLDGASEPIVTDVRGNSYSMNIDWTPLSRHTYRVVPYNKLGEKGAEKTEEFVADDYEAVIDILDAEYIPQKKQICIKWSGTNVQYVDIYLNDELLAENYKEEEYNLKYVPQAGATYVIMVSPYNENGSEGEDAEETLVEGEFDVPDIDKLQETSCYGTDADKRYTGFSKPAVNIRWTAEENGVYEIYHATKNARSAYSCIDRVRVPKGGSYTYKDNNARIGTNYYKIRQVIKKDDYIGQELSTALSDSEEITVKLPKPKVSASLTADAAIMLSIDGKKEFVSGYTIFRKNKGGSYKQIAEVTDDTYIDRNMEFGKQYSYKVKSFYYDTKTKKKYYSAAANVKARNTVGSFTVQARQVAERKVRISWEEAANAKGYEVYYKSATQGDSYKLLEKTDQLQSDIELNEGSRYCFFVKAYKKTGTKKVYFSTAETELKTGFSKPNNFRVSKTAFRYDKEKKVLIREDKLAWDKVYGAKGYYIDVYNPAKKKFKTLKKVKGGDNTSYVVSNNLPSVTGISTYRIRSYSGSKEATGENLEIRLQIGKVDGVKVTKAGRFARVSWKQVAGAEQYRVYRSNGRSNTLVGTTDKLNFIDKGLSAGVVYSYYVQAVSDTLKSEGEHSEQVEYTRKLLGVEYVSASSADQQNVELEWSTEDGASGHIIYYRVGGSGEYKVLARVSGKRMHYTHKNVTAGVTYYYKVSRMEINAGGVEKESAVQETKIKIKTPTER